MSDLTFRTKVEKTAETEVLPEGKEPTRGAEAQVEVPYLDYEKQHGHPYPVDYFKLGDSWQDHAGGFAKEISIIEEYLQKKIEMGELANDRGVIEKKLREMEKINNLKDEVRAVVKVPVLAAYIKFLGETEKIKFNLRRYKSEKDKI